VSRLIDQELVEPFQVETGYTSGLGFINVLFFVGGGGVQSLALAKKPVFKPRCTSFQRSNFKDVFL
jgi:hypothetical protein